MALQPVGTGEGSLIGGLRDIALRYVKEQALAQLAKAAPWLFGKWLGWLSNPLVGFILDSLLGFLLDKTILGVSLVWIAIDVQYDVKSAEDATRRLREILENPEAYTQGEIAQAEKEFDEEAVELIRIGMSGV